jgi:hypothetical protein
MMMSRSRTIKKKIKGNVGGTGSLVLTYKTKVSQTNI